MSSDSENNDYSDGDTTSDTSIEDRYAPIIKRFRADDEDEVPVKRKVRFTKLKKTIERQYKREHICMFFNNPDDMSKLKQFFENIACIRPSEIHSKVHVDRVLKELFVFIHLYQNKYDEDNNNIFSFIVTRLYAKCKETDDKETVRKIHEFALQLKHSEYDFTLLLPLIHKKNELYGDSDEILRFTHFVSDLIHMIKSREKLQHFHQMFQRYSVEFGENEVYVAYMRSIMNNVLNLTEFKTKINNAPDNATKLKVVKEMNLYMQSKIPTLESIRKEKDLFHFDIKYMSSFIAIRHDYEKLRQLNVTEYDAACVALYFIETVKFKDVHDMFRVLMSRYGNILYASSILQMLQKAGDYKSFVASRRTKENVSMLQGGKPVPKYKIYVDDINGSDSKLVNMLLKQINLKEKKTKGKNMLHDLEKLKLEDKKLAKTKSVKFVEMEPDGNLKEVDGPVANYKNAHDLTPMKRYNTSYLPWLPFNFKNVLVHSIDIPKELSEKLLNVKKSKDFKGKRFYYTKDIFFDFLHEGRKEQSGTVSTITLKNNKIAVEIAYIGIDNIIRYHDQSLHLLECDYRSKKKAVTLEEKIYMLEQKPVDESITSIACWKLATAFRDLNTRNTKLLSASSHEIQTIIMAYKNSSDNIKHFLDRLSTLLAVLHPNICPIDFVDAIATEKVTPDELVYIDTSQLIGSKYFRSYPAINPDAYSTALYEHKRNILSSIYETIISQEDLYAHGYRKKCIIKKDNPNSNMLLLLPPIQPIEKDVDVDDKKNTKKVSTEEKEIITYAIELCREALKSNIHTRTFQSDPKTCRRCKTEVDPKNATKSIVDLKPAQFCGIDCVGDFSF